MIYYEIRDQGEETLRAIYSILQNLKAVIPNFGNPKGGEGVHC